MQDMYVGDIGDYGKYGLLRALFPSPYKLGIAWYLVSDENHLNDGKHIDYLSSLKYIDCDRELFILLKDIISTGRRNVRQIEQSQIFPAHTIYYSEHLSYDGIAGNNPHGCQNRLLRREKWLNNAIEMIHGCDAIFLDPDNGLEILSVKKHSAKAPKYVYYDEVKKFLSKTNTLVIYHHLSRNGDHVSQIKQRGKILCELVGKSYEVLSLRFRPYSPRAYFVITNRKDMKGKVLEFVNSGWKQCFEFLDVV